jgi:carboxylesterase
MPCGEPIFHKKGKVGCLLCHGFTGTPDEMKPLAEYLAEKNISINAPRLPGHGTTIEDMKTKTEDDWYQKYTSAYKKLEDICEEVFICGLSMGGILTLQFAAKREVAGIITLATPVKLKNPDMQLLRVFGPILKNASFKKKKSELKEQREKDIASYDEIPIGPATSLTRLILKVRKKLPKIKSPIIILQGLLDGNWIKKSAKIIHEKVSSEDKEIVYLENSAHVIPKEPDSERVNNIIYNFIKRKSKNLS